MISVVAVGVAARGQAATTVQASANVSAGPSTVTFMRRDDIKRLKDRRRVAFLAQLARAPTSACKVLTRLPASGQTEIHALLRLRGLRLYLLPIGTGPGDVCATEMS
jgi:hypothetical protein